MARKAWRERVREAGVGRAADSQDPSGYDGGMDNQRLTKAFKFALDAHEGDVRKGAAIPYFSHLMQVCGLVLEFGGTEDEAIGALLHDSAEDAGGEGMLARIRAEFGEHVEQIVRQNSDSITASKGEKAPWRERKEHYLAGIATKSPSALLVSICDKIHNARSLNQDSRTLGESHWDRFNASREDSLWYYNSLVQAFESRRDADPKLGPAIDMLRLEVGAMS